MVIKIIDSTLREGRQSVFFDTILQIQDTYLDLISQMGISDIEYRNPSINTTELEIYRSLKSKFPNTNFHVHVFLNRKNIDWAINDHSVEHISTFIKSPLTDTSLEDLSYLLRGTSKKVRVGIENVTLVSNETLEHFINLLKNEEAVDRIAFSDTLGKFTPEKIHSFLARINTIGLNDKDVEFHLHNDYGLAASNAVQLLSEVDAMTNVVWFSTSMFGIGERNGILSYGDLLSNMIRLGMPLTMNLQGYGKVVELMEKNNIYYNRDPICSASFSHFASSHIIGETSEDKYHNIPPEVFGMKTQLIFNDLTGQDVFKHIAQTILKKPVSDDGLLLKNYVVKKIKEQGRSILYFDEVVVLLRKFYEGKTLN